MKLKLFLLFLFMCKFSYAQDIRVFYKMSYKSDSTTSKLYDKIMILDSNKDYDLFHSYQMYKSDSITEASNKKSFESGEKFMDYDFTVKIDRNKKVIDKFYRILFGNVFKTSENITMLNWKVESAIKQIGNFNCQKATLSYKGREWIAWFTADISLQKGPYVFHGLPGLIIYMADTKHNFEFMFEKLQNNKTILFNEKTATLISKSQLKKLYLDFYYDPFKEAKLSHDGIRIETDTGEVKNPNFRNMTDRVQSDIKRYNNPIELSEIIKFP
ncbi:GLPGLI family protein [Chryseobacterium salivictor]|uniref:GLPGLI family protein n=1 Tax=Chryseobacterium salivictor TaxID=2547600 RepID=A0A4P6ZIE5_9FLAO|nr:GLPGLI family protein [Chryseobacterium salivictor]QBO59561.1 hypothetical protein NBC122_02760 [Chryseobacterium salivictor]